MSFGGKILEEPDQKDKETIILQKFNEKVHRDSRVRNAISCERRDDDYDQKLRNPVFILFIIVRILMQIN